MLIQPPGNSRNQQLRYLRWLAKTGGAISCPEQKKLADQAGWELCPQPPQQSANFLNHLAIQEEQDPRPGFSNVPPAQAEPQGRPYQNSKYQTRLSHT